MKLSHKYTTLLLLLSLFLGSCKTEIEDLPTSVQKTMEYHNELVDAVEIYSLSLNQNSPAIFHDSIFSVIHDQINSMLEISKADKIWLQYDVNIRENNAGILSISNYDSYDRNRHKLIIKKTLPATKTVSGTNVYPTFHATGKSHMFPVSRKTIINYETVSDTEFDLKEAKVVSCTSNSTLKLNGRTYNLEVSTRKVVNED